MVEKKRNKKKFYITTSIAYTNAPPHIGFALELVQADVLARQHRIFGEDVFFLTGVDEHGIKNAKAAEDAGETPQGFADKISAKFQELTKVLNISNNDFIRTTDRKRHWPVVQKIWRKLEEKRDLELKEYEGWYCTGCEAFITKRTEGSLPGGCSLHPGLTVLLKEKNWFFKFSKYSSRLKALIKKDKIKIIPATRKNEVLGIFDQYVYKYNKNKQLTEEIKGRELEDISFSRSIEKLKWGIPVPDDASQTIYVWADALVNYISALGYPGAKFKKYWPADVHCIGKDILKFHAAIWPGMLLSLGIRLPKKIFVHGFITVAGQKMSKSLGNVVDPFELIEKYGTDAVRYFLLREIPPAEDGDFTYEKFEARYNSDLAKGLGNLVARVITLAEKSKIKNQKSKIQIKNQKVINGTWKNYRKALEEFKFNEALIAIWNLISFCDRYIERQQPWRLLPLNPKSQIPNPKLKEVLSNLLFTLDNIAQMLEPFLPETSEKIFEQLKSRKSHPLFPRLDKYA